MRNFSIFKKIILVVNVISMMSFGFFAVCGNEKSKIVKGQNYISNETPNEEKVYNLNKEDLTLESKNGAVLIDEKTDEILYANRANIVAPMASTTKIMTAILAIEKTKDFEKFSKVDEKAITVEGSSMGLLKGDYVNMNGLLSGLLLRSGNDSANEIAIRVVKNLIEEGKIEPIEKENGKDAVATEKYIEKFVELMNEKAKELDLDGTKFSSPSGLGPEDILYSKKYVKNETTAKDLARLASYAFKNDLFKKICSSEIRHVEIKRKSGRDYDDSESSMKTEKRVYANHNKLVRKKHEKYYKYACGVKTGFTREAGKCLVAAAEKGGVSLVAVVLNDKEHYKDCKSLFEYGFSKYKKVDLAEDLPEDEDITKEKFVVIGCEGEDRYFKVKPKEHLSVKLTEKEKKKEKIIYKIKMNPIFFKVSKGEKVGEIEYYLGDKFLCKTDLLADRTVSGTESAED